MEWDLSQEFINGLASIIYFLIHHIIRFKGGKHGHLNKRRKLIQQTI